MLTKSTLPVLFFLLSCTLFGQETRHTITGQVIHSNENLSEVHIINLKTGLGVVSDDFGHFSIAVKENDTLLVSSIQYVNERIGISKEMINLGMITITLSPEVNILDEVYIHGLSGNLLVDIFKIPEDTIPKHNFVYRPSDLKKILPPDNSGPLPAPNALAMTDPTFMEGTGARATLPARRYEAMKAAKIRLAKKKEFPEKIRKELGNDFFLVLLKIPEDRIDNFITYCENKNIGDLYLENKILEIIEIFREESKNYLALEE